MKIPLIFQKLWPTHSKLMFRLKGTVILKIWPQILAIIVYTTAIVSIYKYVPGMEMNFKPTYVKIIGMVIGLLLVFRTNTGYDRYYEGRRIWSSMTLNIRILSRVIWLCGTDSTGSAKNLIEKTTAMNLLVAFAYATKNYLREEYSYEADEKIKELINHVPRFISSNFKQSVPHNTQKFTNDNTVEGGQKVNDLKQNVEINQVNLKNSVESNDKDTNQKIKNSKQTPRPEVNLNTTEEPNVKKIEPIGQIKRQKTDKLNNSKQSTIIKPSFKRIDSKSDTNSTHRRNTIISKSIKKRTSLSRRKAEGKNSIYIAHDFVKPTNIPLELAYYIDSYCIQLGIKFGTIYVNSLILCLTQFERILRTPMPLAYSVHLHHSLWLYILALPFQLVGSLGWVTIPVIAFVTFALVGILAIGWEIENPFGYDDNDLPLDDFCEVIKQETRMIFSLTDLKPECWIFSPENTPFIPKSSESALDLSEKKIGELRTILANFN